VNRLILLDLLRFFAAFAVVLYHYTFDGYMSSVVTMLNFQELGSIFQYGNLGVELFFMISGFVILLSTENKTISYFVISRITRLYPAFWVAVTLTTLIITFYGGEVFDVTSYQYLINLTMINEVFHVRNIDGVYWTLFVEIRFYFLIFLLMLFRQMKFLKFYLLIWSLISILYNSNFIIFPNLINFFLFQNVAPFFIAGSIFYLTYRNNKFICLDYLTLLLSFISAIMFLNQQTLHIEKAFNIQYNMLIIISIVIFFYFLFYFISKKIVTIKRDKKVYMIMGGVTYPLYLIHTYIGYIIFNNMSSFINKYILLFGTILLMLLVSYSIHILIEKKLGKYMKKKMLQLVDKITFRIKK